MNDTLTDHYLSKNLRAALRVAGRKRKDGTPGPLHGVTLQQSTRIARSTLCGLKSAKDTDKFNADLRTLSRLAQALGIPLPFLLMRPEDWKAIAKAVADVMTFMPVAENTVPKKHSPNVNMAEQVLEAHGVHPERPPRGGPPDQQELDKLDARNNERYKAIQVLGALMLPTSRNRDEHVLLTALTAALANHINLRADLAATAETA